MSVERIAWLILGVVVIVWSLFMLFTDEPVMDQEDVDVWQNIILAVLSLGMAARSR